MAKDKLLRDYLGFVENWRCHRSVEKCTTIQNILERLERIEGIKKVDPNSFENKINFLVVCGFTYNFERDVAVNKKSQMALSIEYIKEHPVKKLKEVISKKYKEKPKYFFIDKRIITDSDHVKILNKELFNKRSKVK